MSTAFTEVEPRRAWVVVWACFAALAVIFGVLVIANLVLLAYTKPATSRTMEWWNRQSIDRAQGELYPDACE